MLHQFLTVHRDEIIARTRAKVAGRSARRAAQPELEHGVSLFLDQLAETLRCERTTPTRGTSAEIECAAARHGSELRRAGYTISEVVHDYGDVCQAVTELAIERVEHVSADEFKTLNRCLDVAIAEAVTEYSRQRERSLADRGTERIGFVAHELEDELANAIVAFEVLQTGKVGVGGGTGAILGLNLARMRDLVNRSLAEVRLEAGMRHRQRVALAELIEEIEVAAAIQARTRGFALTVTAVEPGVAVDVDRQLIAAAVANLLHNAFEFSAPRGNVVLRTDTLRAAGRVLIEVEDECGGLPRGEAEDLFRPFEQRDPERSGPGLGLAIARRSVEANGGEIRARSVPGRGCVFTIDLPRLVETRSSVPARQAVPARAPALGGWK